MHKETNLKAFEDLAKMPKIYIQEPIEISDTESESEHEKNQSSPQEPCTTEWKIQNLDVPEDKRERYQSPNEGYNYCYEAAYFDEHDDGDRRWLTKYIHIHSKI